MRDSFLYGEESSTQYVHDNGDLENCSWDLWTYIIERGDRGNLNIGQLLEEKCTDGVLY